MSARKYPINLNELFPVNSQVNNIAWTKELSVAIGAHVLYKVGSWVRSTNGKIKDYPDFWGFISLIKFIEAIVIYDTVIVYDTYMGPEEVLKKLTNEGIVKDKVDRFKLIGKNPYEIGEFELMKIAHKMYPKTFEDFYSCQDSQYRNFVSVVTDIAISHELNLPLIPYHHYEMDSILIQRKLNSVNVLNALDMVYSESKNEIYSALNQVLIAQGYGGVLVSPIIYKWLNTINKKKIMKIDEMIDVALEIRTDLARTRQYFRDLSNILCNPSGTFNSYKKAMEQISKLRNALSDMATPEGERIFLFRLGDLRVITPSLKNLLDFDNPSKLLKELGGKQIAWWSRRIQYRHIFHLFSLFDNFLNSKKVSSEVANFIGVETIEKYSIWAKKRDYELRNISKFRLRDDTEPVNWVIY